MKLFKCESCGLPVYFENTQCGRCGHAFGFLSETRQLLTLNQTPQGNWAEIKRPKYHYRYCANSQYNACNWLLPIDHPNSFCEACLLNHTIPDLRNGDHHNLWKKLEVAKHRLVYALLKLNLPRVPKSADPQNGLAFDFLSNEDSKSAVVMGHENGLITINLDEADEVKRVSLREKLHEPYRTIMGHFRHEIGHYYWDRLILPDEKRLKQFRALFGDERPDYGDALQRYYKQGPAPNWSSSFISAYATSHPWEDWAETWAHYMHVMDGLEIAWSFGLEINPDEISKSEKLRAVYDKDPYTVTDFQQLIDRWFPLTVAMNSINRSIGQSDFYPFVMAKPVIEKMKFIHSIRA